MNAFSDEEINDLYLITGLHRVSMNRSTYDSVGTTLIYNNRPVGGESSFSKVDRILEELEARRILFLNEIDILNII